MIFKDLDPLAPTDPLGRAGRQAEEQMAHYLHRAFAADPTVYVLNGLRLERGEDAAQMDHLVLHRYGFVVVESKSVTSRVSINEHGEWTRHYRSQRAGMPSPILQAERQADFLLAHLREHEEKLLDRFLFGKVQKTFTHMEKVVLVAISDQGIIDRHVDLPQVKKADQIPGAIRACLAHYSRTNSLLSLNFKDGGWEFTPVEQQRVAEFLLNSHRPLRLGAPASFPEPESHSRARPSSQPLPAPLSPAVTAKAAMTAPAVAAPPANAGAAHTCRDCGSARVQILWGKYGYYFKCGLCAANTPIKASCSACGARARISKQGDRFSSRCETCGHTCAFHTNTPTLQSA